MAGRLLGWRVWAIGAAVAGLAANAAPAAAVPGAAAGRPAPVISPITEFSRACAGQNAEVEQAVDPARGYVYEEWMGCHDSIGFATSTDGGRHFGRPVVLAGSSGAWDPAVAVAPDGTVYAAFMNSTKHHAFPVVEASFDHGRTFPQIRRLVPRHRNNWGDRDFIAVGPDGTVYLTWDYGPSAKAVTYICSKGGSCAFATGDLNVVLQKSTDGGKTWGPIVHVSPGFPASGGDSAPLLVEPSGRIDVEYQGYHITSRTKYTMTPAHSYFTSSANGGTRWSAPVRIGPARLTMSLAEWWIDGDISADAAGNLYATWDTQHAGRDIGWLSYSTDHGRTWSPLQRVTPDADNATHIVQVAGGRAGIAYVGWLADNSPRGYALYLRPFSIKKGWLSRPIRVSRRFGNRNVWPGDTFGISMAPTAHRHPRGGWQRVIVSWGSAISKRSHPDSEDFAAIVAFPPGPR
jgi:BNR/Asp-box repeat